MWNRYFTILIIKFFFKPKYCNIIRYIFLMRTWPRRFVRKYVTFFIWWYYFSWVIKKNNNLFYHPNILASTKFIEDNYSLRKKKILVFGRFTRPLKALCELLNAREIVRRVQNSEFWPQFKLNKEEELAVS